MGTRRQISSGVLSIKHMDACNAEKVYSKVSGEQLPETPTIDMSSKEFYGEGYDDSDQRIPDMT
ncbi:hypothetical protein Fmac_015905 [Flemingia macrophylla]|uniref:Uncharacterized protein n=1 Tax=Flemingia macrophylla TaxID=520843 RepID=A0ABD1MFV8_9FABA